jgi:glutamyl-tRNA reductase
MLRRTQLLTGECAVLSTCGRFEIYWIETGPVTPVTLLAQVTGLAKRILTPAVCSQSEGAAARHLLRVAAGLESPLMGEAHVLGQVRTALLIGQSAGAVGPVLSALFRAAIHTGRRVRSEAGLTRLGRDYTQLAVSEALRTIRPGGRALVIGAGSLGCAVARALAGHGVLVSVISRHAGRAQTLAAQVCGLAWDFDDLDQAVRASDVIVACTSAPQPMLTRHDLPACRRACWYSISGCRETSSRVRGGCPTLNSAR